MNNLVLKRLTLKNFKSFGDYETTVKLDNRGAVLITGCVDDDVNRSNGAGKSSLIEAIIWCLFGRLSNEAAPGDKVINWSTKKNCYVSLMLNDGYEIVRTRKYEGHSDLLIYKDGTVVEDGDSTNANAQQTLNKLFNLNFDIFLSSVFFGQFSSSFVGLSDQRKKHVVEKLFGLSKFKYYVDITKQEINVQQSLLDNQQKELERLQRVLDDYKQRLNKAETDSDTFDNERERKIYKYQESLDKLDHNVEIINIEEIKQFWNQIDTIKKEILRFKTKRNELSSQKDELTDDLTTKNEKMSSLKLEMHKIKSELEIINTKLQEILQTSGTTCFNCNQPITEEIAKNNAELLKQKYRKKITSLIASGEQIAKQIKLINNEMTDIKQHIDKINNKIQELDNLIAEAERLLEKKSENKMTIREAEVYNENVKNIKERITELQQLIKQTQQEPNPYQSIIDDYKGKLKSAEEDINKTNDEIDSHHKVLSHLQFIYKAYAEKRNLRSYIVSGYLSMLNDRLGHYLNELDIDMNIEFNNMFQVVSDKWGYDNCSGGEKKRIDLSIMCALYDTFRALWGDNTNILILDEIDKELDASGVESYVQLIMNNLCETGRSVFVISHKNEINHLFPEQIRIDKRNGCSVIT